MAFSSDRVREGVGPSLPADAARVASGSRPDSPRPRRRFPRSRRLTSRRQFREVYRRGIRSGSPSFLVFGLRNDAGHCRLGVTVTRKFGGAVVRNRAKRRLRELFRLHQDRFDLPLDLVFNVRSGMPLLPSAEVEKQFLRSIGVLSRRLA